MFSFSRRGAETQRITFFMFFVCFVGKTVEIISQSFARRFEPASGAEGFGGGDKVEAAIVYIATLLASGFGCADIHTLIDEHGICGEDGTPHLLG